MMKPTVKTAVRIGRIEFMNALPYYHKLDLNHLSPVEYVNTYPAQLNLMMRKGKLDIALISSLEYLNHQELYSILPGMTIGARDFSGSVILFSKEPIQGLAGKEIALSRQSLSSAVLLRILLQFKYKMTNEFKAVHSDPDKMLEEYPAALVIGDDALLYHPKKFVYKYDLSELWWNWTEKPFCFALWAVRKKFAQENPEWVSEFHRRMIKNLETNLQDLETLIKEGLQLSYLETSFSKIFGYLFNLHYGLDESMLEGLNLFYRFAHRLGFSPKPDPVEFFKVG
ncbi:MAG: menaquinone biosynthesis protein [Candidatus Omnitrophica bacterium]|nr:menaquinone biosynthesis protein [Candidatus Omnitrophota bacterium]